MFSKYRRFVTSSVGFSFVVVGLTGIIFKFFFKTHPLEEIHGWLGVAMVAAACLHIAQNLGPIKKYLTDVRVLSLLVPVVAVILYFSLVKKDEDRGVNPRQVVRKMQKANLNDVAKVFGKDPDTVTRLMGADGLKVEASNESLDMIAKQNQKSPDSLLNYFM